MRFAKLPYGFRTKISFQGVLMNFKDYRCSGNCFALESTHALNFCVGGYRFIICLVPTLKTQYYQPVSVSCPYKPLVEPMHKIFKDIFLIFPGNRSFWSENLLWNREICFLEEFPKTIYFRHCEWIKNTKIFHFSWQPVHNMALTRMTYSR